VRPPHIRRRYTRFFGNSSDWRQYSNPSYFEGTGGDAAAVYAWINIPGTNGCNTLVPYICEYPSSLFPCYPPYVTWLTFPASCSARKRAQLLPRKRP
jgi:hypothetical protein